MGIHRKVGEDGFLAKGASLLDLFETASQAMLSFEYDTSIVAFERELAVSVTAATVDELLEGWLSNIAAARGETGTVIGDVIVVEVGEPPNARYGTTDLAARGTARGRATGGWFFEPQRPLAGVAAGSVRIEQKRKNFEAFARVVWR